MNKHQEIEAPKQLTEQDYINSNLIEALGILLYLAEELSLTLKVNDPLKARDITSSIKSLASLQNVKVSNNETFPEIFAKKEDFVFHCLDSIVGNIIKVDEDGYIATVLAIESIKNKIKANNQGMKVKLGSEIFWHLLERVYVPIRKYYKQTTIIDLTENLIGKITELISKQ